MVAIAIFSADPAMRRSLEQLLREDSTFSIVGVVDNPAAICLLIDQNQVKVVLGGGAVGERLGDWGLRHNQTALVIFVDGAEEEDRLDALYAGARAILPRTAKTDEIVTAIKAVTKGLAVLPSELLPTLLSGASLVGELLDDHDTDRARLTPPELVVLAAIGVLDHLRALSALDQYLDGAVGELEPAAARSQACQPRRSPLLPDRRRARSSGWRAG